MPIGAELQPGGGVHFRVWAPRVREIVLHVDGEQHAPQPETDGYYALHVPGARAGSRYGYRVDGGARPLPDPASRFQPEGPHKLSAVVDPAGYHWGDAAWRGCSLEGQVAYEFHVGTFTTGGTWQAAAAKLPLLKEIGISLLEMMPVAEFPGRFGWGYDGVSLFAPTRLYGEPDHLRAFIDRAHQLGLGVVLDVVYNHFGPDGNYLPCFSDTYLTKKYPNEWGDAINFDGEGSAPVREFVRENAAYWIREFHFDGLRLDATQQIFDGSREHIVAELTRVARAAAAPRGVVVIAENEPQDARLVRLPAEGGDGLDAIWNDDFHHTAYIAMTGHCEAYYTDYTGSARELLSCVKHGFLYQGQRSSWQKTRRGSPSLGLEPAHRVTFLENHDQVANSDTGKRLIQRTDDGRLRAMTALLLLGPGTPMLFQGQEFATTSPFLYFADHKPELAELVAKGRREFLLQFPRLAALQLDLPHAEATFRKCVIDWEERDRHGWAVALHRDLIALRRNDPVLSSQRASGRDGSLLAEEAFLVRFFSADHGDRLLIVNLGRDLAPTIFPDPLLAPPEGTSWQLSWSSEDPRYGGHGIREPEAGDGRWFFQGHATALMSAAPSEA
jgi:maltooligosyltrehalose trehalohydrolase